MGSLDGELSEVEADLLNWLTTTGLARRLADALFHRHCRLRLARLDHHDPARAQLMALTGLVHRARGTRFGLDHDLARVRTPADFQRLVPLRRPEELWRSYGSPARLALENSLWPGAVPYLATCQAAGPRPPVPLPVTAELLECHRQTLWAALALVLDRKPAARLLSGQLLFVGGDAALTPMKGWAGALGLEELARAQFPWLIRPYAQVAPQSGAASLDALADRASREPVTLLAGNLSRLLGLAQRLAEKTGRDCLRDTWPGLVAVLYSRGPDDPPREKLEAAIGDAGVLLIEGWVHPAGVLALEDPRCGMPRLLTDTGVYFEFVPLEDLARPEPRRCGLAEVAPEVPHAVALTSPAGLWGCLTGWTVTFAQQGGTLLRTIEVSDTIPAPAILPLPVRLELPESQAQVSRPRNAGIPAARSERLFRTPWSRPADHR